MLATWRYAIPATRTTLSIRTLRVEICSSYPQALSHRFSSSFSYITASAWHPKPRTQESTPHTASASAEKDADKTPWWKQRAQVGKVDSGEDSFFTVSTRNNSGVCIGIADGVGGIADLGIDPSIFSHTLMDKAATIARDTDLTSHHGEDFVPTVIMDKALWATVKDHRVQIGASTACIATLDRNKGELLASNLGDSSYHILRAGSVIYSSPIQEHYFNCPFQLSIYRKLQDRDIEDTTERDENDKSDRVIPSHPALAASSLPTDALQESHQLSHGDVVILATDGFTDNVFTADTSDLVTNAMIDLGLWQNENNYISLTDHKNRPSDAAVASSARSMAKALVNAAHVASKDNKKMSPFATEARQRGFVFQGGKQDDITVVLAVVLTS